MKPEHPYNPFVTTPRNSLRRRPIYALTLDISLTYKNENIQQITQKSKKVLSRMIEPFHNGGKDNANYELIISVDDNIGSAFSKEGETCCFIPQSRYVVISALGSGTFGQVLKCRNCQDNSLVAVKILKSKPVFFRQGMLEIAVLTVLRDLVDPDNKYHTVKMLDYFLFHGHVCIVTELLSINLYDMLRSNKNNGMGLTFNRHVLRQLLESLHGLTTMNIIHCDVKTENVLLVQNTSDIKLIDFGSACFERSTLYTYIQSRHYRAIEIILGLPYSCAIDMWSFGCVAAELFLGIPLFPGENEYNQLAKIIDMLGPIPDYLLRKGTKTEKYFNMIQKGNEITFKIKPPEQFEKENNCKLQENRKYFRYKTLEQICQHVPMHRNAFVHDNDQVWRALLHDFLKKTLEYDPAKRLTPSEALTHPFIKSKTKQELLTLPLPLVPQDVPLEDVVRKVYGGQYTLNYLQSRDRFFSVPHNYFTAFIRSLKCGYVMNILHINPFHFKPLKVIGRTTFSWHNMAEDESLISWGSSNSDSEDPSRARSASSLQSPSTSQSPRLSLRPPPNDPRRLTTMVRDFGYFVSHERYNNY
ncbi:protein kinase domain containing protein [Entamoeba histolytica HM-1:IMSS-B]|uniref:Protein kinase domain containing protein n=6 Tax=Entamoeba histolytica TaxID=5759 RepID=C4LSA4_ENTH1|nr:protein kinase domain containing protein [Entamoeba histolytica HM-1:IMSS]EMD42672.1 serine/threonine protein kinase ppk15, putative [Entamoeba histolytica KU27]EMH75168.1 protein kinase domain containing protein [Entamoeba histolytica HM-1:IMSS-B]EMS14115.1 serine/threonine protein kinase ppk15, putative [Entamoeba histolytica HM-3:IMSS]ENY61125.1 serine/threonine protein kinase ppk15, putative [Entamoeba histolytica HM-1:IMSS-A]GAT91566.1 protein kinase domain containing protein [Entamoeb|eukprot:XP_656403.1 protein kinase domain containing protein [Entamoeba histolytica HM-1:IMSS]